MGGVEKNLSGFDPSSVVAGVILAGGGARRMGGQAKGGLNVAGRPMLARIEAVLRPQVAALAISVRDEAIAPSGLVPLLDEAGFEGPLAGLLAGLGWAERLGLPWLLTVPNDTPFLPGDLVSRLHGGCGGALAALAASGGRRHPVIGLWSAACAQPLRDALTRGERRVDPFATAMGAAEVEWPVLPVDPFFNVNTPEDHARARHMGES